ELFPVRGRGHGRAPTKAAPTRTDCGLFALWLPGREPDRGEGAWLRRVFGDRAHLAVELHREDDDAARLDRLLALAEGLGLVPLAAGDVHMATRPPGGRPDPTVT